MKSAPVLIVFSSSELGGAERSLTRMALAAQGPVTFDLATLDGPGPWSDWCRAMGAEPIVLGYRRVSSKHGQFGIQTLGRLIQLVRMQRYEALYVIGLRASLLLRLAKPCLRGARLVQGVRWNPNSESCLDRAFRLAERVLGRLIDLYICNSKAAAQTIDHELHIPPRRVRVIYNGLAQIPATLPSFSERSLQVLTIANLSPRKGYLEYIEQVVAPLCKRLPEARFVIVGRDEMAGAVQRKIANLELAEVVTCVGFQQDVSGYFGTACVFALPSLWNEGCPTSILEAMAHGLPTVAFALDGIPELVEHDVDGILVPLKDYERMGKAIEQLLQDPARAMCMGMRGRDKVMTRFKVEHSAAAHVRAFDELLLDPNK